MIKHLTAKGLEFLSFFRQKWTEFYDHTSYKWFTNQSKFTIKTILDSLWGHEKLPNLQVNILFKMIWAEFYDTFISGLTTKANTIKTILDSLKLLMKCSGHLEILSTG